MFAPSSAQRNERRMTTSLTMRFAAGSLGVGLLFSLANSYFIYFVTDVALVPAEIMGTVFLITRVFDFCWTPIVAGMMQNTRSKAGKYRSWILYIIPITSVATLLCFTRVKGHPVWVAIYYGVAYLLAYGLLDKPGGAQKALMTRIATSDHERITLTSRTAQFETFGNILFAMTALPLVNLIGKGDQGKGFFGLALIVSVIGFITYFITARAAKPYDVYHTGEEEAEEKVPFKTLVKAVIHNPPLIISMSIEACRFIGLMVFVSTMAYYFKYVLEDFTAITPVLLAGTIVAFLGSLVAPAVTKRIGIKNTNILAMSILAISMLLARFLFVGNLYFFAFCICLMYFGSSFQVCSGIVMFSKTADYYEHKTSLSTHGFVMSNYVLPVEIGIALSAPMVGWFLAGMDYQPNVALTASQMSDIQNLVLLIPGLIYILAAVLAMLHPLSGKRIAAIDADLAERRAV